MHEGLFQPIHLLVIVLLILLVLVGLIPYWHIFKKAGFSPWLSLLMVIPLVQLIVLYYVAFAKWPEKTQ
jgi:hypothetical protein